MPSTTAVEATHILLVDDCEITLEVTKLTLEGAGYRITTLANPHRMVAAIREAQPDAILLDIFMPGLRGDQVVPILKNHRFSKDLPILLFSDNNPEELARTVLASGADGFVAKSDDPAELAERLRRALDPCLPPIALSTASA